MSKIYILDEEGVAKIKEALGIDYDYHSTEDAAKVDTAISLLAPTEVPEGVMELVEKILTGTVDDGTGHKRLLKKAEVAALLAAFTKRVPRVPLAELWRMANKHGYEFGDENEDIDAWAAKHGVKVGE